MDTITYGQALKQLQALLINGYPDPYNSSLALLSYITDSQNINVLSNMDNSLSEPHLKALQIVYEKLKSDIPIAYIINNIAFYNESYYVDENVLIPRPESELLVDIALRFLNSLPHSRCLEIGTGSGCLSISILNNTSSELFVVATEKSKSSLVVAKKNANQILSEKILERLSFKHEDLFVEAPTGIFDLVISNPPYIPQHEYNELPKSLHYEPSMALTDENDGLEFYRRLTKVADNNLADKGKMLLEIHSEMAQGVKEIFNEMTTKPNHIQIHKDVFGRDRVIEVTSTVQ